MIPIKTFNWSLHNVNRQYDCSTSKSLAPGYDLGPFVDPTIAACADGRGAIENGISEFLEVRERYHSCVPLIVVAAALKIAGFLRPPAHHLYGIHNILLLVVVGVA